MRELFSYIPEAIDNTAKIAERCNVEIEFGVTKLPRYEVPEGCYFMLGDNRNVSKDSRYWLNPYVEKDKIIGKAFLRYWPLNKISLIE